MLRRRFESGQNMRTPSIICGICCGLLIASCAPHTEVVKLYEDPAHKGPYARLLVVTVSSDSDQRRELEDRIIAGLRERGVDAVPSYTLVDKSDGIPQSDIDRASAEVSADGILITHFASIDTTVETEPGREDILSECRGGDPLDYFLYDYEVLKEPDTVRVAHTVVVISNLYDSASSERVWTIQSTCFERASMAEVLHDEAAAIVRQLGIDGLI